MASLRFSTPIFIGGTLSFSILAPSDISNFDLLLTYDITEILSGTDAITVTGPGVGWSVFSNLTTPGQIVLGGITTNETPVVADSALVTITLKLASAADTSVLLGYSGEYNDPAQLIASAQVTLVGSLPINTAPELTSPAAITYTNTSANDTFAVSTGNLSATDAQGNAIVYGLAEATVSAGVATKTGSYGSLSVDIETGAYKYTPNDIAIEALNANASESFEVSASDGSLISIAPLVVRIAGAVDVTHVAVNVLAYSWKAHTLLDGVSVSVGAAGPIDITDTNGVASLSGLPVTNLGLSVTREVPTAETTLTANAVNLQDAIAILKMIVGLDVNGAGKPLSPYQSLAADFDGNGTVGLTDAIGVLKHVVGLTAPEPTWHFLNEADATIPAKVGLTPGTPTTSVSANLAQGSSPVHVGLVGYLSGDVDGSFVGLAGAADLDKLQPTYIADLVGSSNALSLTQFGVYGS